MFHILLFILGTIMGSFLNVLHIRYNPDRSVFDLKTIGGRSHCPHCNTNLTTKELIPILSFLIQGGKCRSCNAKISLGYPIVEVITGLIFFAVAAFLNNFFGVTTDSFFNLTAPLIHYAVVALWLLVFTIWILITLIDLKHYLIPDELNIALGVLGIMYLAILFFSPEHFSVFRDSFLTHYNLLFSFLESSVLNHIFGGLVGLIFFGSFSILTRGRAMGMGDAKLALPSGFLLGWADIGLAIALSFILGGIAGVILLTRKKKTMQDRVPFAPFLVLGFALTFFFGTEIVSTYFTLFPIL